MALLHLMGDTACVGLSLYEWDVGSFLFSMFSPAAEMKVVDNTGEVKQPKKEVETPGPLVLPQMLPGLLFNVEASAPLIESSTGKA